MGSPRRLKKKYETPSHPWEKERIKEENRFLKEYGLKNKTEIWKAKTQLKKYRQQARELVGLSGEERQEAEKILVTKLQRLGILQDGAGLDEILSLKVEDILSRRLQTIVWKKGMAITPRQARQFITHGHIALNGRKITAPGMIIELKYENEVNWYGKPIELQMPKQETALETIEKAAKKDKETTKLEEKAAEKIIEEKQISEEKEEKEEANEAAETAKEIQEEKEKTIKEIAEEAKPTPEEKKAAVKVKKESKSE